MIEQIEYLADDALLSVEQLARLIHKSPSSVRSDASRNIDALPPVCRLPGSKRLLWRREDVSAWIARFVQVAQPATSIAMTVSDVPRKRGRPRKVEARGQA